MGSSRADSSAAPDARTVKPRICVVYPPGGLSGAFIALQREVELLADVAEFLIVIPRSSPLDPAMLGGFSRVIRVPMKPLQRSLAGVVSYLGTLVYSSVMIRILLEKESCARVQLNCFSTQHGAVLRLLGYRGKIATWVRSDPRLLSRIGRLSLAIARWASDSLIAVSNHVAKHAGAQNKTRVVYDPAVEAPFIGSSSQPSLVCLGNYSRLKSQHSAIEAFHRVYDKHPGAELVFHGSHPRRPENQLYYDNLQRLASTGPAQGRIRFESFVPVTEGLANKRAALLVSESESFGLACQDASAHGLPVIATRSGGTEEIVDDGRTGFLIDVGDVPALADRMDRLLSDWKLAQGMGQEGVALMHERFPVSRFRRDMREIFGI